MLSFLNVLNRRESLKENVTAEWFFFFLATCSDYLLYLILLCPRVLWGSPCWICAELKAPGVPEMQFVIMFALDRDLNKTLRLVNSFFWGGKEGCRTPHPAHSSEVSQVCLRLVWTAVGNLGLLTHQPVQELRVNTEDSGVPPKSLFK